MSSTSVLEAPAAVAAGEFTSSQPKSQGDSVEQIPLKDIEAAPKQKPESPETGENGSEAAMVPPVTAVTAKQRWNTPRINTWRVGVTFYSFINLGLSDASFGAVLPYVGAYYNLSYLVVSLIFLSPFVGYSIASISNDRLHNIGGQRGIATIGPFARVVAFIVITQHPPYPVVIIFLILNGFGNGLIDAAWNAYIGDFASANQMLGMLHACYGLGGVLAPLIATTLITKANAPWWVYFYIPLASCVIEMVTGAMAFWGISAAVFRRDIASHAAGENQSGGFRLAIREKVTWYCAAFLFIYVGAEVSLGGWLVTFMRQVRSTDPFHSGITATGFWAGLTLGRIVLGFVTPLIGERLAVTIYLIAAIALELVFWLVPSAAVSATAAALLGFAIGPLFPAAIVAATKLLPKALHVPSIGFAAAIGGGGAALVPFAVGALAQSKGVQALEPVILALLACDLGIWLLLPRFPKHDHRD